MQTNRNGSITFGTNNVKTDEYLLLAKACVSNGSTVQQAALEIKAIDDMLSIMKMRSVNNAMRRTKTGRLRKDSALSDILSARIGLLVDELKEIE
jgi:hypothetical protein